MVYVQQQPQVVIVNAQLGKFPAGPIACPFCQATITTSVTSTPGCFVWSMAGILCIIGAWPCCLIPFCVPSCMDAIHTCPNCRATLGASRGVSVRRRARVCDEVLRDLSTASSLSSSPFAPPRRHAGIDAGTC